MFRASIYIFSFIFLVSCNNEIFDEISEPQACDNGTFVGDVLLTSQQEVEEFGLMCYTGIEGNLIIGSVPGADFSSDITNLNFLGTINSVTDRLIISHNPNLESLSGLENINDIKHLDISFNDSLLNLDNLNSLPNELTTLWIWANDAIINLEGLEMIEKVTSQIGIQNNFNLETLEGLNNLVQSESYFFIGQHDNLTSIEALSNLQSADLLYFLGNEVLSSLSGIHNLNSLESLLLLNNPQISDLNPLEPITSLKLLQIQGMDGLTDLQGLNNLTQISGTLDPIGFTIINNNSLTNLSGLESLISMEERLRITGNDLLVDYCSLENLFINGNYLEVDIENNNFNPTIQDIMDGNCSL